MAEIYLDNNATTRPFDEVREAVAKYMSEEPGNPSSPHGSGRRANRALEEAREAIRSLVGAVGYDLVFTSGGSESNSTVLRSVCASKPDAPRVITTPIEHSSILSNCAYLDSADTEVAYVAVDHQGRVNPVDLEEQLAQGADLLAVHWVNSETGVIQDVAEIAEQCRVHGVPILVDAAQAIGKIKIDLTETEVDYLSFSGHKFHGPQGVGGLFVTDPRSLVPLVRGGDQERGLRAGTQNLPGIVGMGVAAKIREARLSHAIEFMTDLRDRFEAKVRRIDPSIAVNGDPAHRVGNTTNLRFPGIDGQAMLARLDAQGVFVSQGTACTSHRPEPSTVLTAMGLSEDDAYSSLRFSFSELNTLEEVERAAEELERAFSFLRSLAVDGIAI